MGDFEWMSGFMVEWLGRCMMDMATPGGSKRYLSRSDRLRSRRNSADSRAIIRAYMPIRSVIFLTQDVMINVIMTTTVVVVLYMTSSLCSFAPICRRQLSVLSFISPTN